MPSNKSPSAHGLKAKHKSKKDIEPPLSGNSFILEEIEEEVEEECSEEHKVVPLENENGRFVGTIDLHTLSTAAKYENSDHCYPYTYYTLSAKEHLLLTYAENFRRHFALQNPHRRPLVVAVPNECEIFKFVCTTIRPTAFAHKTLIRNLEGILKFVTDFIVYEPLENMYTIKFVCTTIRPTRFPYKLLWDDCQSIATFVADFITYEPLPNMMSVPKRLISPDSLLKQRVGNSFEMATLLCSMLIGAGYTAFVVSGVARAEVVENNLTDTPFPYEIPVIFEKEKVVVEKPVENKRYKLRPMPDLTSHLEENFAKFLADKAAEEQRIRDEANQKRLEELELVPVDEYHYRRSHAWVAIIENAPWSTKPLKTHINEEGEVENDPPTARFFEPSTGFESKGRSAEYILIDSIWDHQNYYVNKQTYQRVTEIRWDLRNLDDWEHLLPGEPPEMRTYRVSPDEFGHHIRHSPEEERHLDTIRSWVMKLHISETDYDQLFPETVKTVLYKRAAYVRYSPYTQLDGKVAQLTLYDDDDYMKPTFSYYYFENRLDKMRYSKYTYATGDIEENFFRGRIDSIKYMRYNEKAGTPKEIYFFYEDRLDMLWYVLYEVNGLTMKYKDRTDFCYYKQFHFESEEKILTKYVEKFRPNPDMPPEKDVAVRTNNIAQKKIALKFQYKKGALTASTYDFVKPVKPEYGKQLVYDPNLVRIYLADPMEENPTPLVIYRTLMRELDMDRKLGKCFKKVIGDMNMILERRQIETDVPQLTFRIFDSLRNGEARTRRLEQKAEEEELDRLNEELPPDYVAPYLVAFDDCPLSQEEAATVYRSCLSDMRNDFITLLNDLQNQYEDLVSESNSLKRFLNKFGDRFNRYDYDNLTEELERLALKQRMVQLRLATIHEESQKKYETLKESLLTDPRLGLEAEPSSAGE